MDLQDDANVEPPEINGKDWPKTMKAIDEWLRGCLDENSRLPMAYVIRGTEDVQATRMVDGRR